MQVQDLEQEGQVEPKDVLRVPEHRRVLRDPLLERQPLGVAHHGRPAGVRAHPGHMQAHARPNHSGLQGFQGMSLHCMQRCNAQGSLTALGAHQSSAYGLVGSTSTPAAPARAATCATHAHM